MSSLAPNTSSPVPSNVTRSVQKSSAASIQKTSSRLPIPYQILSPGNGRLSYGESQQWTEKIVSGLGVADQWGWWFHNTTVQSLFAVLVTCFHRGASNRCSVTCQARIILAGTDAASGRLTMKNAWFPVGEWSQYDDMYEWSHIYDGSFF